MGNLVDIRCWLDTSELRDLVDQLEYPAEMVKAKTAQILGEYREHAEQPILGLESEGGLVSFIGLRFSSSHDAVIRHIAVRRDKRRYGLGREMIAAVFRAYSLASLTAETDRDAVEFYRRVGFEIESLGEKYPGVERFQCVLKREVG
jgi:ribosomal protein S18 acetylase RimI-like enzyme